MNELDLASLKLWIEILLIVGVSFVGASIHEYVFRQENQRSFFKNPNVWISTIVSSILCYIINPWIINFNPRLILLPPLLLGLAGMDLVMRLATVKGSTSIIEYILGFFGVQNHKEDDRYGVPDTEEKEDATPTPLPTAVINSEDFEKLVGLDQMVHASLDSICNLLVEFYVQHDKAAFLRGYHTIKVNLEILQHTMLGYQVVPMTTALKLSEILKKEIELDHVYHNLTNQTE